MTRRPKSQLELLITCWKWSKIALGWTWDVSDLCLRPFGSKPVQNFKDFGPKKVKVGQKTGRYSGILRPKRLEFWVGTDPK